jgi:hypothetical protein
MPFFYGDNRLSKGIRNENVFQREPLCYRQQGTVGNERSEADEKPDPTSLLTIAGLNVFPVQPRFLRLAPSTGPFVPDSMESCDPEQ